MLNKAALAGGTLLFTTAAFPVVAAVSDVWTKTLARLCRLLSQREQPCHLLLLSVTHSHVECVYFFGGCSCFPSAKNEMDNMAFIKLPLMSQCSSVKAILKPCLYITFKQGPEISSLYISKWKQTDLKSKNYHQGNTTHTLSHVIGVFVIFFRIRFQKLRESTVRCQLSTVWGCDHNNNYFTGNSQWAVSAALQGPKAGIWLAERFWDSLRAEGELGM